MEGVAEFHQVVQIFTSSVWRQGQEVCEEGFNVENKNVT